MPNVLCNQHSGESPSSNVDVVDAYVVFIFILFGVDEFAGNEYTALRSQHVDKRLATSSLSNPAPSPARTTWAIAEVLDSIDEAIEATEAVVAATEQPARRPATPTPHPRRPRLAFGVERRPRPRHNPRLLGSGSAGGSGLNQPRTVPMSALVQRAQLLVLRMSNLQNRKS